MNTEIQRQQRFKVGQQLERGRERERLVFKTFHFEDFQRALSPNKMNTNASFFSTFICSFSFSLLKFCSLALVSCATHNTSGFVDWSEMNNLYYIHKIRIFVDRFVYESEVVSFHYFF